TVGLQTNLLGDVVPWVAIQVSAGYDHNILLRPDGSVHCWGDNQYGQCSAPTEVANPEVSNKVVQVAAGHYFSVALMADGTLRGWGDNRFGQLNFPVWSPTDTDGLTNPTQFDLNKYPSKRFFRIVAGANHVVGLLAADQIKGDTGGNPLENRLVVGWGDNSAGQIRFKDSSPMFLKGRTSDGKDSYTKILPYATQIAAGVSHSLILTGPLNQALPEDQKKALYQSINRFTPAREREYRTVVEGMVFGFGSDSYGQATAPNMRRRPKVPIDPSNAPPEDPYYRNWGTEESMKYKMIAAGGYHSMAVSQYLGEEKLYCWGLGATGIGSSGDYGQVNDDPTKILAAVDLTNVEPTFLKRRATWSYQPQVGIDVSDPRTTLYSQRIAGGLYHTAAISWQWDTRPDAGDPRAESAVVVTWGRNAEAQCNVPYETDLSISRKIYRDVPLKQKSPLPRSRRDSNIRAIWAGGFMPNRDFGYFNDFVVGIDQLGMPVGWGDNSYLQHEFFAPWSPVVFSPNLKYRAIAPGGHFSWLLDSTTRQAYFVGDPLFCFADEFYAPAIGNLEEVSAGGFHSLFRTMGGQVYATGGAPYAYFDSNLGFPVYVGWGQGAWDADGNEYEDAAGSSNHEHLIPGLTARKISAGWFHSAAIRAGDGSVVCWGAGESEFMNPLDPTASVDPYLTPNFAQSIVPAGIRDCTDVAAGGFHTAALKDVNLSTGIGTVVTWGSNATAQTVLNGISSMAIDASAAVFRRTDGSVVARGAPAETDIQAMGTSAFVAAGFGTTAWIGTDGTFACFGALESAPAPLDPATGEAVRLRAVAVGEKHLLGIRPDGTVVAWGITGCNDFLQCWSLKDEDSWSQRANVLSVAPTRRSRMDPPTPYKDCINISSSGARTCVDRLSSPPEDPVGLVRYSNDYLNYNGSEGNENALSCCVALTANLLTDRVLVAAQVSAGSTHSLALRQDGGLQAWGATSRTGNTFSVGAAVSGTPTGGVGFIKISSGNNHNIALRSSGSAQVWGDNTFGQVTPELPQTPGLLDFDVRDVAAGARHTVILKADGRVYAWGDETYTIVNGVRVVSRLPNSAAQIPDNTFGVAVAAGGTNTAVLRDRLEPRIIGALASLTLPTFSDTMPQALAVRAGGFHTVVLL
ncbi:MAG: hypothetical protein FJ292_10445, partial [Planctomycetes bacterium]|nr:hypothetical protein [Planctomycetota bacterium]